MTEVFTALSIPRTGCGLRWSLVASTAGGWSTGKAATQIVAPTR
jgi:hypothetical protein